MIALFRLYDAAWLYRVDIAEVLILWMCGRWRTVCVLGMVGVLCVSIAEDNVRVLDCDSLRLLRRLELT